MHGTFACHGPRAVARASDTHDPQCQPAPEYVLMTPMHQMHCCPTCEGLPARVYGYAWCLIDPLHSALEKGVTDLFYGVVLYMYLVSHTYHCSRPDLFYVF